MKKVLTILLVVALCCVLFAGCGKKAAGQVVLGTDTEASGDWSYAAWTNNATDNTVLALIDDCLTVQTDKDGNYIVNSSVVKSLETAEDDAGNKTYTITLNKGLKFNNGEDITAKDFVAWTLFSCSSAAKDLGVTTAAYNMIPGGADYREGAASCVSGLHIVDEHTFTCTILKEGTDGNTYLPYYYDLGYAAFRAVNSAFWFGEGWTVKDDGEGCYFYNENGQEFTSANVGDRVTEVRNINSDRVSAGPYNLVNFDTSSRQITLEVNANYCGNFEGQKPGIEKIVIVKTESDTAMDMLSTGQIDFYADITDGSLINAALDLIDNGLNANYVKFDRAGYGKVVFVCDFGPTQFVEVRQAIAHLLDRTEFANTFCQGWGGVVDGPYCTAFSMYKDSEELFAEKLDSYEYSLDKAKELLVSAGFVFNADGSDYDDTVGGLRYKKVTADEAGSYKYNVTLADGTILMPCIIEWAASENNPVADLLAVMLKENPNTAAAGVQVNETVMTFPELLNYMYRQDAYGLGGDYSVPTYNMMNLAAGWNAAVYDFSYEWTSDPDLIANGYNYIRLYDDQLDTLSMDMVYGVDSSDYATYLDMWQQYVIRWNQMLPELPLYANIYISVYPNTIKGYEESSFWGFSSAILYCEYVG